MTLNKLIERLNKLKDTHEDCGEYEILFFSQEGKGSPMTGVSRESRTVMINTEV